MSPEHTALLYARYPAIFAQRHLPMIQSSMWMGFSCQDGWFDLIEHLCSKLHAGVDRGDFPQIEAVQVKEKCAELRLHCRPHNDAAAAIVNDATERSRTICEVCGAPGVLRGVGSLVQHSLRPARRAGEPLRRERGMSTPSILFFGHIHGHFRHVVTNRPRWPHCQGRRRPVLAPSTFLGMAQRSHRRALDGVPAPQLATHFAASKSSGRSSPSISSTRLFDSHGDAFKVLCFVGALQDPISECRNAHRLWAHRHQLNIRSLQG